MTDKHDDVIEEDRTQEREKEPSKAEEPDGGVSESEATEGESSVAAKRGEQGSDGGAAAKSSKPSHKRPTRWLRGGVPVGLGGFLAFCIMALEGQYRWGVPVGVVAIAAFSWGLLDLLGTFDDDDETVAHRFRLAQVGPTIAAMAGTLLLTLSLTGLAVAGRMPIWASALSIPASFLGLVVSVYRFGEKIGAWATDETGRPRSLLHRHGFWVVVTGTVLFLPMLGSYSLSDPWETHYGEVAREILARNDWISTWWAQDGWFWSKPVLNFWTEALSMSLFGAGYQPDQMLASFADGRSPWPEWAIRMPVFIFTIVALYFIYKAVANVFGRRAGLLGALVLSTMPYWYLIAHQTMTDLPFVASMTTSMAFLLLGLHTDPNRTVRTYELDLGVTRFRLSGYHLVLGVIVMTVAPQVFYLLSRNVELLLGGPWGFRPHADVFFSGSAGNCGLPGNQDCTQTFPVNKDMQPAVQALIWAVATGLLLWLNHKERRLSRLFFLAGWFFAAVSTMGKGPAGFALPALCAGAYIFATGKWKKLLDLEFISGLLIILAVAVPWYTAMFMRHGQAFTDRLLFHDMWKRAIVHVHDTNAGVDVSFRYFVWQLGYGLFPWTGLVPVGLVWWLRRREDAAGSGRGDVSVFLAMWFVFAFALFTAMLTKFHHYIFPAVPPAAMLTGIVLDRMMGDEKLIRDKGILGYFILLGGGVLVSIYGLFRCFPGMLMGFKPEGADPRPGSIALGLPLLIVGIALLVVGIKRFGACGESTKSEPSHGPFENTILGATGIAAALVVGLVGFDLASQAGSSNPGQANLMYLFTYNYKRTWPDSLEFSGMITAFAIAAAVLMLLLVYQRIRAHIVVIATMLSIAWAAWGLNIYLVKTSPHWGQREIIAAYFSHRASPEEQIVAFQMNWKGENFYTSNRIPAFVSSGQKFKDWIKKEKERGVSTMFFVTEHGRARSLESELGEGVASFEKITDKRLNNKFAIFKVKFGNRPSQPAPENTETTEEDDG
ncbi:MAG TPA: glycosyltransferase family 39 protein [Polyangiaceae bacterium]|jgi:4-amino-4-deoxy-L-arabinose transferase-like glycosyltransferase|nr:MAG: Undecaprenyl phosphate-alpha-4-amino-4-deoxy-L-arabinose arabinosyl transferase [Deltaproteobacteria bacterium ADurb.Bin207]HNS97621.1 glycosyltransferase family 39 protein [Polyangiaceae bacterium]HNZ24119.1 glycosyltransferase family 39 protein [Polyangiaceae bacterium]HOD23589.1 glycosyltransferase family 39 protein [Polyangiaceae bacterium]HOE48789.1 glycosyltransferase family 39 protein [Polyangiaceae bacterium]